jgi:glutamine synthetase
MKLSQQSLSAIEKAIQKAVNKYAGLPEQSIVTDIHLQPNQNSGDLIIFDDEDKELACISIEELANDDSDDFYEEMQHILQTLLSKLKEEGTFDRLAIMTPYNFVLVDEDKETVAELLIVDDDTLIVNDDLLKGLDEELDTFMKDLLNN